MTIKAPANPAYGYGQLITTGASQTVSLGVKTKQLMLTNLSGASIYVRIAPDLKAATVADAIVPPNRSVVYTKFEDILDITVFSDAEASLHIMPCEGFGSF